MNNDLQLMADAHYKLLQAQLLIGAIKNTRRQFTIKLLQNKCAAICDDLEILMRGEKRN